MAKSGSLKKKPVGKKAPTEPIAKQDILIDKMIEASSYAKVEGKPRTLPISADVPFDPGDYRNKGGPMKVLAQVAESTSVSELSQPSRGESWNTFPRCPLPPPFAASASLTTAAFIPVSKTSTVLRSLAYLPLWAR